MVKCPPMKGIEEKVRSIMTSGGTRHRASAPIFFLLAALIALASGPVGPSSASAKTPGVPQNRVWGNSAGMLQSRPIQTPQSLELQRENSIGRYDSAVGDTLAAKTPIEIAEEGGRHSGFLKNYLNKPPEELQNGIQSLDKQIAEHQAKLADPEKAIPNFKSLDARQQQALLKSKWPSDIKKPKRGRD